jgi:transposase-like protein
MYKVLTKVVFPHCYSANIKKNGIKPTGKQHFYCKDCHRQFQQIYQYQGASPVLKK